jgi:WD40 repeat protein
MRAVLVLAAVTVAIVAAAFSPPGRAVVQAVRESIGIAGAQPALFRLPSPGRVLVSGPGGAWVVAADGSKRRVGDYREAAWSPHALYVLASSPTTLAALEPNGTVHWTLERRDIRFARWGGSRTDTRVSYLSRGRLHVVGGDGVGDVALGEAAPVAPVWQPGPRHLLAYVTVGGRVTVLDADDHRIRFSALPNREPDALAWSPDGNMLVLAARTRIVVYKVGTTHQQAFPLAGVSAVAFAPDGTLTLLRGRTVLELRDGVLRTLFTAPGSLAGLAWSPDGRWLLTALPAADQWIFLQRGSGRRVLAVSHLRAQFGGLPALDGWVPGA